MKESWRWTIPLSSRPENESFMSVSYYASPLKVFSFERPLTRVSYIKAFHSLDVLSFTKHLENRWPMMRTSRAMALPFRFNSQKKPFQQEPSHDSLAQQFEKTGQSMAKVIRFWQPWSLCNEKLFYESKRTAKLSACWHLLKMPKVSL